MPTVDLLVLASSMKRRERCVAGWDLENDRWVRPVSSREDGALELRHCAVDGRWPDLFDVVRVELAEHQPTSYQPENWLIADRPWHLREQADSGELVDDLRDVVDHDNWLLEDTDRRVSGAALRAKPASSSLVLVEPTALSWRIETAPWGAQQHKADFSVDGTSGYDFAVTDIPILGRLEQLNNGHYPRDAVGVEDDSDVFLTISLAEPYSKNDQCYKLAAAIVEVPA